MDSSAEEVVHKENCLLQRGIFSRTDFQSFQKSEEIQQLKQFMKICIESIQGKSNSSITEARDCVNVMVDIMIEMNNWVDEIPPLVQPSRFGNKAFRVWFDRLCNHSLSYVERIVGLENFDKCKELSGYLEDSFGNSQRVDYGTGHETTFFVFLCHNYYVLSYKGCLYKVGILVRSDLPAVIILVFPAYLKVCRHLQTVYWLEPAGSHGVWCLDDYQLLPFVLGSAQFIGNDDFTPNSVNDPVVVDSYSSDYLYFEAIKFINITKSGPFEGHSPLLFNISKMQSWKKVNSHLQTYWTREVLGKFPVMQHLRFGTIFPMTWEPTMDMSRRQLVYVNAPKQDSNEKTEIAAALGTKSYMSKGYQEEFTSIHKYY